MSTAVQELIYRIKFDPTTATAETQKYAAVAQASLRQIGLTEKQQAAAAQSLQRQRSAAIISQLKQEEREAARSANARLREESRSLRQKIAEETRASREVGRITAETARQAIAQERVRERAAKQLADVQIREAKRAARELEQSLKAQGSAGGGFGGGSAALLGAAGRIPGLSGLTSELGALASATQSAGAAQGSLAGPIGLATAAAAAQVGVMFKLNQGLFNLARSTAQFQGNLFDMSQQLGISVETLSTLEVLATTTGGNIETVASALAIFQKNLEASHDPTSRESKLLAELGVTSADTEEALAQTLQGLFKLGEGSRQTAAVLELFGRSGRFVNAILKESEGDLEAAKAKFAELGIVVDSTSAKVSDQFNDTISLIQFQLRGIAAELGNEIIPSILSALQDLHKTLKDNREAITALAIVAKTTAAVLAIPFKEALGAANLAIKTHGGEIKILIDVYKSLAAAMQLVTNNVPEISPNAIPPVAIGGDKSGITLLRELQQLFKQSQGAGFDGKIFKPVDLSALEKLFKKDGSAAADPGVALLRQLQSELRRLTTDTKAAEIAEQLLGEQFKDTNESLKEQIRIAARLIDTQRAKAQADQLATQLAEKQKQEIDAARDSLAQFMRQQSESLRQLRFGDKTALQEAEEFIAMFPKWTGAMKETEKFSDSFWLRLNAHIIDSIRRMKEMIDLMRETSNLVPLPGEGRQVSEELPKIIFDDSALGQPPLLPDAEILEHQIDAALRAQGAFAGLGVVMSDVFGLGAEGATAFADSMGAAFAGLAQAAGEAVRAFVLFGEVQGGFRKHAAEVIASIAQMAVVQAIWEGAQGLAMLALTWFTGNPKYAASAGAHFAAAAAYGLVAGVAIPLGRAVAGNTFKQGASGGSGGGFSGESGSNQLNPITMNRNQPHSQTQRIIVEVRTRDSEFGRAITAHVVKEVKEAGQIREALANDGAF